MSRRKKTYPPGTFIPTPQRLMAIAQLCIAFSLVLWYMFQPFMGEYFALRSRMLLYEYAMGTSEILKERPEQGEKLARQVERFEKLPEPEKAVLKKDYQQIQAYAKRPALQKIGDGLHAFILEIPPLEQAWIFFSITIAILILLKSEGARQAAWLLPLLAAAYILDNRLEGNSPYIPRDYKLFPTEEIIVNDYLTEPLSSSPVTQKQQLEEGWKRYLVDHWSQNLKQDQKESEWKVEEAEFNFTIARLNLYHGEPMKQWLRRSHEQINTALLVCYLLWNIFFAWIINRQPVQLIDRATYGSTATTTS